AGNHAFVPHASHGITFRDTIAYDVLNEPYWWDPSEDDDTTNDTNDLVWERAVAAAVDFSGAGNQFRMAGFMLGDGTGLTIRDSVAVGIRGTLGIDRSGFSWPEHAESTWTFENKHRPQQRNPRDFRVAEQLPHPPRRRTDRLRQRGRRHPPRRLRERVRVSGPRSARQRVGCHRVARPGRTG